MSNPELVSFTVPSGVYPFTLYPNALHYVEPNGSESQGPAGSVTVINSGITIFVDTGALCL